MQAAALIFLCASGIEAVDACLAIGNGARASWLAAKAQNKYKDDQAAIEALLVGWLPEGWV